MTKREIIEISFPVLLIKEGDYFIISCDPLAVYSQSKSRDAVFDGFVKSVEHLLNILEKEGRLLEFLRTKRVIVNHFKEVRIPRIPQPALELGYVTQWTLPAEVRPLALAN
jgi:predicted RNase H-like HicB family nuclease